MRIRYCPKCGKAGLKWEDPDRKGCDGLTDHERWAVKDYDYSKYNGNLRYCPRCKEWVIAAIGANIDQHKRRY